MLGRRSFLALLGMAPAAAKTVGAESMSAMRDVTGVSALPVETVMSPSYPQGVGPDHSRGLRWLADGKIPAHVEARLKRESAYVGSLDPDLVTNRSMSWSTKIRIQRGRNYERAKIETVASARMGLAKRALPAWLQQLW